MTGADLQWWHFAIVLAINGCIEDHEAPRRVSLVALDWFPGGES